MAGRYKTAEELSVEIGGIKPCTIRSLRLQGMPAVRIGRSWLYNTEKALAWIAAREESTCLAQTEAHASNRSLTDRTSTSSGTLAAPSGSVAQARQTAERLKQGLRRSSTNENSHSGQLVHLTRRATG